MPPGAWSPFASCWTRVPEDKGSLRITRTGVRVIHSAAHSAVHSHFRRARHLSAAMAAYRAVGAGSGTGGVIPSSDGLLSGVMASLSEDG
jgi:hypothetical protein